jgi:hypothetical protein
MAPSTCTETFTFRTSPKTRVTVHKGEAVSAKLAKAVPEAHQGKLRPIEASAKKSTKK